MKFRNTGDMRFVRRAVLGAALALQAACTQQQIYTAAQQNRALECQKYPDTRYEECMATVEKDYATYERELEAVEKQDAQRR